MRIRDLLWLGFAEVLAAATQPNFRPDDAAWNSTDVVVLVLQADRMSFRVAEAIKGDLAIGTVLPLNELLPSTREPLSLAELTRGGLGTFSAPPPLRSTDRIIAFLRRPGALPEFALRPELFARSDKWQPGTTFGGFLSSAAWIQDDVLYCFAPSVRSPGLVRCRMTENELRDEVRRVLEVRERLDKAVALTGAARANALGDVLRTSSFFSAQGSALNHLNKGGVEALIVIQALLDDDRLVDRHMMMLMVLAESKWKNLRLSTVLEQEAAYWPTVCHGLASDWMTYFSREPNAIPFQHFNRAMFSLRAIERLRLFGDQGAVKRLAAAWSGCPPHTQGEIPSRAAHLLSADFSQTIRK